ncbi:MAG: hypothetical protein ACLQBB_04205 [Solirubrobacteraceae bacterium]
MSSPIDDERILEAAERIDGLSEGEQQAALGALGPSDREQVLLTMLTQATMVEDLTAVLVAALEPEPAERYTEALQRLSWRVLRVARTGAQREMQAAVEELVDEHPELEAQAETVVVFLRGRAA